MSQLVPSTELVPTNVTLNVVSERFIIAGHSWAHMGVHGDKDIWVCVQEDNRTAYVAICDLHDPRKRWRVTKREWVRAREASMITQGLLQLQVNKIGWHKTLLKAQQAIALLVHRSQEQKPQTRSRKKSPNSHPRKKVGPQLLQG